MEWLQLKLEATVISSYPGKNSKTRMKWDRSLGAGGEGLTTKTDVLKQPEKGPDHN